MEKFALLLVSAKADEGIRDQTKRHLFISRMLGIDRLVVAVNKMDLVGYKKDKFDEIEKELKVFIEKIGFSKDKIYFVPVSAYKQENLIKKSSNMGWYKGKSLIELLYENANKEEVKAGKDLRVILQGYVDTEKQYMGGKIVSGSAKIGERVKLLPVGFESSIKEIIEKGKKVKSANTGISVAIKLKEPMKSDVRGLILSSSSNAVKLNDTIKALIFVTHTSRENMHIKFNNIDINCNSMRILKNIDPTTGNAKSDNKVKVLDAVEAELVLERKIPFESYDKTRELGRFVLYSDNKFSGIGIVE